MDDIAMIVGCPDAEGQKGKLTNGYIMSKADLTEPMFYASDAGLIANLDGYLVAPLSAFSKRQLRAISKRIAAQRSASADSSPARPEA